MEIWKVIKNCPSYEISNEGRIRTVKTGKLRSLKCESKLYVYVNLYVGANITKNFRVHRLVAEAFIENPNNLPCVNHINGNKKDNRMENLEWCSYSYNTKHAYQNGFIKSRKLFNTEIKTAIKTLLNHNLCCVKDLCKILNVSNETIYKILRK